MKYPRNLKMGDTIGICAPSCGIVDESKLKRLDLAYSQLKEKGYSLIETKSVRNEMRGRSASGEQRAKEFMELMENPEVGLILYASGGDFLVEMLDFLDWEQLRSFEPKWTQGYSDITSLSFLFNTILDMPTIYCQTVKDYAMRPLHKSLNDALSLASGKEIIQNSFEKYEIKNEDESPMATYNLTEKVEWKNLFGEDKVEIKGRSIGGCLDCIKCFFGTKYDKINEYIEKYKNDGIVWFLEVFEMSTPEVFRVLWQMKNSGYFNNCSGIIFGRPLFIRNDYDISFSEAVKDAIGELNIPIIYDADIGHVSPQLAIVSGAILEITSIGGKGIVKTFLK